MSANYIEESNRKELEEKERKVALYNSTVTALQTEERFVNYFKNYRPDSVASFINQYAMLKANWYQYADDFFRYAERDRNKWRSRALELLFQIQLRKVFSLKCRWAAGELDIEGVESSYDLNCWRTIPALYYAVEPISREEVDCYISFLRKQKELNDDENMDDDNYSSVIILQFFHRHRTEGNAIDMDNYNNWFRYYDEHFGTANLLQLPVTRLELELDYHDTWESEIHYPSLSPEVKKNMMPHISRKRWVYLNNHPDELAALRDVQQKFWAEQDKNRPKYRHMNAHGDILEQVIARLETKEVQELYRTVKEWNMRGETSEQLAMEKIDLTHAKETIPIQSADDWKEALKQAAEDYRERMTLEVLPLLYEEYAEAFALKKPFSWKLNEYDNSAEHEPGSWDEIKKRILAARKHLGEPENFDFLKKENLKKT